MYIYLYIYIYIYICVCVAVVGGHGHRALQERLIRRDESQWRGEAGGRALRCRAGQDIGKLDIVASVTVCASSACSFSFVLMLL
jgi:hypothetical protein